MPIITHKKLLLNCDMGESLGLWSMGLDEQAMPLIDMANIACGFHASDPLTMNRTVLLAKQSAVKIGAHPSYPDLVGFGRRSMQLRAEEIISLIHYQVGALAGICQAHQLQVSYVKPHGALYNDMMRDQAILKAVMQAIASYDSNLPLMLLAKGDNHAEQQMADALGIKLLFEAFADRAYDDHGLLLSRDIAGAVLDDPQRILDQAMLLATEGKVVSHSGQRLSIQADTLCVHGDNPESLKVLQQLRKQLNTVYNVQ
ncbi:MAG: 5-oxoprolinase subunit PxpA [Methylophaga sp.]|nr:5-oxoprolinase subunit PxpA [Methylophaga sp.]